ncbi:serine protease Do [Algisphaera agarilytica]|uniref:Serine protease Do n=2 Tax=Algisphaera agarilytica TaxID=1385975 RepID=A0A7X0H9T4_9BACT|nr:serine protease Do [Algisphaera agarilytica]
MQRSSSSVWFFAWAAVMSLVATAVAEPTSVFDKPAPESLEDLREIEARVEAVAELAAPATVSLDMGRGGSGSGVIIGDEGYILTAAHVIGEAGQIIQVRFPDGTVETAETLGLDRKNDAGLAQLQGEGPWPSVEMAAAGTVGTGDWVVSLGHPGGFDLERSVVVRLGRVLRVRSIVLQSDCSLIGGDSGGPLFNMDGKVVGIHSRIGKSERANLHISIGEYHSTWDSLVEGRQWGRQQSPEMGIVELGPDKEDRGVVVIRMVKPSAASEAGIKLGDIITGIGDRSIRDDHEFHEEIATLMSGDKVAMSVLRDDEELQLELTMGEQ